MALIDRGRVMTDYLENIGRRDSYKAKYEALSKAVDEASAVEAEPVRRGNFTRLPEEQFRKLTVTPTRCEVCGNAFVILFKKPSRTNICPCCGARRDNEED